MVDNTSIVARLEIAIKEVEQNPNQFYVRTSFLREVLTALKTQESVKVIHRTPKVQGFRNGNCPQCGALLNQFHNANNCGQCGQKVKWE